MRELRGRAKVIYEEGYAAALVGNETEARASLARLTAAAEGQSAASIQLALGDSEDFMDALESAYSDDPVVWGVRERFALDHDPELDVLRDDPRFQAFLDQLPPYPGPNARRE